MPTYQYVCEACNDEFEVVQSFTDPTLSEHDPGCGGHVRKRFNAVGVVFKGSGFYRNDSRGADTASSAGESSSESKPAAATSSESATPAKTESKPSTPAPASTPSKTTTPAKTSAA